MAVKKKINTPSVDTQAKPSDRVVIKAPNFMTARFEIIGTSPLVINKFSRKSQDMIIAKQEAGSTGNKERKKDPKDFEDCYNGARYIAIGSGGGWDGFNASSIRNAAISACRTVGFKMTLAKLSVFVVADGYDEEGTSLIRITEGEPHMHCAPVRNDSGVCDIRARPMWNPGWRAVITMRWDADQFTANDIVNLLNRIGLQVGICEGRNDSKSSAGCGWGSFELVE